MRIRKCNRRLDFILEGIRTPIEGLDENGLAEHFAMMAAPAFANVLKKYRLAPGDSIELSYKIEIIRTEDSE